MTGVEWATEIPNDRAAVRGSSRALCISTAAGIERSVFERVVEHRIELDSKARAGVRSAASATVVVGSGFF